MIEASELILNTDGSVYHLHLRPEQVARDIITVGDPGRVHDVSRRFDRVDTRVEAREFVTHTGELNGRRLTVVSTGIGTDNVDIVLNELDALFNVDLHTREIHEAKTELNFLRLGTSGAFQADLPLDSLLLSEAALGLDGLLSFYSVEEDLALRKDLEEHLAADGQRLPGTPTVVRAALPPCLAHPAAAGLSRGVTLTAAGFYAPQGRRLRLPTRMDAPLLNSLRAFRSTEGLRITNLEMETAGIYGLASALGHRAASLSALLANRASGTFSRNPAAAVERLIDFGLLLLTDGEHGADAVEV